MGGRIDKLGRIVVPKPVRERTGLHAGVAVELEETPAGVLIRPAETRPRLVRKGKLLVYTGKISGSPSRLVEQERDARIREVWGR